MNTSPSRSKGFRQRTYEVIFEAETPNGKLFDVALLVLIAISVLLIFIESVEPIRLKYQAFFTYSEWIITALFTLEYILRLYSSPRPIKYASSLYGIIDLLSILPTFAGLLIEGSSFLRIVRAIRLLRVFRIFKLGRFLYASQVLTTALKASRPKIVVFLGTILIVVCILGSFMYLIEGPVNAGFSNIPKSMYWAVVTMTTVGYGDVVPVTDLGKFLAASLMIMGYGVIAVPTGIVTSEITAAKMKADKPDRVCANCTAVIHEQSAVFCHECGVKI